MLRGSLISGKDSSEFKLVSLSVAGQDGSNHNADADINDTSADDDLNRAGPHCLNDSVTTYVKRNENG